MYIWASMWVLRKAYILCFKFTNTDFIKFNFMAMIAVGSMLLLTFTGLDRFVPLFGLPREAKVRLKKVDKKGENAA